MNLNKKMIKFFLLVLLLFIHFQEKLYLFYYKQLDLFIISNYYLKLLIFFEDNNNFLDFLLNQSFFRYHFIFLFKFFQLLFMDYLNQAFYFNIHLL